MKTYLVISLYEKLNLCEMHSFLPLLVKMGTTLHFKKVIFENLEELENILIFLSFFIKISCQSKESPYSPTPLFLESLILILIGKLEEVKLSNF